MTVSNCSSSSIAKQISQKIPQLLILHFDVNETLLVADAAGGDTHEDSLNKIIAKSAFCKIPPNQKDLPLKNIQPEFWMDGSLINDDIKEKNEAEIKDGWDNIYTEWDWPDDCCPYYKTSYKKFAKCFTEHPHGRKFQTLKDQIRSKLCLYPANVRVESKVDKRISHDGIHHYILPAFFECIYQLLSIPELHGRVRIVIRTFGSDLSEVKDAINAFAEGNHPYYPDFQCPRLKLSNDNLFRGRWTTIENSLEILYQLNEWSTEDTDYDTKLSDMVGKVVALGDKNVLDVIEGRTITGTINHEECYPFVCGIQDDYNYWSSNNYLPSAGKPVWIRKDNEAHHIFFDDNIHNDPLDSIVSIRSECIDSTNLFQSLDGREIINMHGKYIVKVPTIEPCLNRDWFLSKIYQCLSSR